MCDKSESQPTWQQLEHAIRRNFGGLDGTELDPLEVFKQNLPSNESPDLSQVKPNVKIIVYDIKCLYYNTVCFAATSLVESRLF